MVTYKCQWLQYLQQAFSIFGRYPFRKRTVCEEYGQDKLRMYGKSYWEEKWRRRNYVDETRKNANEKLFHYKLFESW